MSAFKVVIPARYASTRLPGKPLLDIGGKPMVVRVAERAASSGAQQVLIATDHPDIFAAVTEHGFQACMTRPDHPSGTDRIAEVAAQQGWSGDTIVVNVQGDEPLIPPALVRAVADHLHAHAECAITTACHPIHDKASIFNPNVVKVVLDHDGNALYFSRAPIPWPRDNLMGSSTNAGQDDRPPVQGRGTEGNGLPPGIPFLRHIGLYAYRTRFLHDYGRLAPSAIEQAESLEQLRALYHGYRIGVTITMDAPPGGVDTEQDWRAAQHLFALHPYSSTQGGNVK